MPDIVFESREALPEELRSLAKDGEGGKVVINLVAADKLKEFRDNNIAVSKERDTFKGIVEKINTLFPEFDPDKAATELTELRSTFQRVKDGKLTENKDIEEELVKRTAEMKRANDEARLKLSGELKASKDAETALQTRLKRQTISQAITTAAMDEKVGVHPKAIRDIVNRAYGIFQVDENDRLTPKDGDNTLYGADGATAMSVTEWLTSLKDDSPYFFKQSSGGGGNGGGGGDKKFGGFTEQEFQKLTPTEKLRIANEANRPKGY